MISVAKENFREGRGFVLEGDELPDTVFEKIEAELAAK